MFDVTTGQSQQVAQHDAPVKVAKWVDTQGGILATGSWDKTIKVCDTFLFLTDILKRILLVAVLGFTRSCASS
jgi:hypothetical protein